MHKRLYTTNPYKLNTFLQFAAICEVSNKAFYFLSSTCSVALYFYLCIFKLTLRDNIKFRKFDILAMLKYHVHLLLLMTHLRINTIFPFPRGRPITTSTL